MNRMLFLVSLMAMLVTAVDPAGAAVFERDWQTPGDGLLTYDDVNRREWLDLSVSRLEQFPEPRLENAIAQISPGGIFDGFTWANRDDVIAFAQSAGVDTDTEHYTTNANATTYLVNLLGTTLAFPSGSVHSIGFIDETELSPPNLMKQVGTDLFLHFNSITGLGGRAGLSISASNDLLQASTTGLMLYRVVPEPTSVLLVSLAIITLAPIPRKDRRSIVR